MCARSLQMHDAVTSALLWEPRAFGFGLPTLCTRWAWGEEEFTESEPYCWAALSLQSATLKSSGFISAKLLSWKNNVRAQSFCPAILACWALSQASPKWLSVCNQPKTHISTVIPNQEDNSGVPLQQVSLGDRNAGIMTKKYWVNGNIWTITKSVENLVTWKY